LSSFVLSSVTLGGIDISAVFTAFDSDFTKICSAASGASGISAVAAEFNGNYAHDKPRSF
jgi:hypothetical protein